MTGLLEIQPQAAAAPMAGPALRTAVAIFVSRFPRLEETSILREMNELEQQGQPIVLVPLLRDHSKVIHDEARPWLRRALYLPLLSFPMLVSNLRYAVRQPRLYFGQLLRLIAGTSSNPVVMLKTLAVFPKSVHLARVLPAMGIRHIHAQFATHPATMAYIVASLSDMTYSFTVHGPDVFVHRLLLRQKIASAKFVRSVSLFNKAFLAGLYSAVAEQKIEVVHVGVNPAVYQASDGEAPERLHSPPRLLSVATLNRTKGFSFALEACSRLAARGVQFEYNIVGTGPNAARIRHAAENHGLAGSVHLLGALPQHQVARLMTESDIFVLPSVIAADGHMDGLPIALMEAMAAGKPVIASAISGIPELVQNGVTGLLVDTTHPERIAEAVTRLLTDTEFRERIGRGARDQARLNFDISSTTEKLLQLFDRERHRYPTVRAMVKAIRWGDLGIVALGIHGAQERGSAIVADVTMTDGISKRDALVKRQIAFPGQSRTPSERTRDEFTILNRLRRTMPDPDASVAGTVAYGVPRVLLFDERHAALVLEAPRGKSLSAIVRAARGRNNGAKRLVTPLRRCGAWLREFQNTSRFESDGRHILTALVVLALQDLEVVTVAERQIRRQRHQIADRLRTLEAHAAERPLPVVPQKGNLSPAGVFISERRVQVTDFDQFREGLPYEDVAEFLLNLRLQFAYPLVRGRFPQVMSAFLDGLALKDADPEILRLFLMIKALRLLASGGARATGTWRDFFRRAALRDAVLGRLV